MTSIDIFLLLLLIIATVTDLYSGRISNRLIVIGLITGIFITDHFFKSISGSILLFLVFFPLFQIGALGAGDIKCFILMNFYLSGTQILEIIFYTFLLAAVYAVIRMLFSRSFFHEKNKIHLAGFILLGTVISVGGTYL